MTAMKRDAPHYSSRDSGCTEYHDLFEDCGACFADDIDPPPEIGRIGQRAPFHVPRPSVLA